MILLYFMCILFKDLKSILFNFQVRNEPLSLDLKQLTFNPQIVYSKAEPLNLELIIIYLLKPYFGEDSYLKRKKTEGLKIALVRSIFYYNLFASFFLFLVGFSSLNSLKYFSNISIKELFTVINADEASSGEPGPNECYRPLFLCNLAPQAVFFCSQIRMHFSVPSPFMYWRTLYS